MYSRCFSLKLPKNIEITEIVLAFKKTPVDIYIHSSKSSLSVDKSNIMYMTEKSYISTGVSYDTFQVCIGFGWGTLWRI